MPTIISVCGPDFVSTFTFLMLAGRWAQEATVRANRNRLLDTNFDVAQPKAGERWLLVTSAFHMPRAVGSFRAAGFAIEAYPVDFRTAGSAALIKPFAFVSQGLRLTDTAAKEWIGLLSYYLTGKTSALFPAPGGAALAPETRKP
jgi:hypothetical protein